ILLQALDVALGGRPDADLVRTGAEEAAVEALFVNVPAQVRERLVGAGIPAEDGEDELLVRRVIARGGRTRAYVNGALGSLALLRELAPHLLRVYGQDEHQALRRVESHRELRDRACPPRERARRAGGGRPEPRSLRPRADPRCEPPGGGGGAPGAARAPEAQVRRHGRGPDPPPRRAGGRAPWHRERGRDDGGARGRSRGGPARRRRVGGPALDRAAAGGARPVPRAGRGARRARAHRRALRGPLRRDRGARARPRGLGRGRVLPFDEPR